MAGQRNLAAAAGGGIDWIRSIAAEFRGLKRATYEDVLNAPEHKVAEVLDGELFLSPWPAPRHSVAAFRLGAALGPFENVLVPDLGDWQGERMPAIPDTAFFSLAPDWVCDVLSPSTERIDRGRKLRIYAEAGVADVWLINPVERTLEVLQLRDGAWTIVAVCSGSDGVRVES